MINAKPLTYFTKSHIYGKDDILVSFGDCVDTSVFRVLSDIICSIHYVLDLRLVIRVSIAFC